MRTGPHCTAGRAETGRMQVFWVGESQDGARAAGFSPSARRARCRDLAAWLISFGGGIEHRSSYATRSIIASYRRSTTDLDQPSRRSPQAPTHPSGRRQTADAPGGIGALRVPSLSGRGRRPYDAPGVGGCPPGRRADHGRGQEAPEPASSPFRRIFEGGSS
jgi:hypothetical protein